MNTVVLDIEKLDDLGGVMLRYCIVQEAESVLLLAELFELFDLFGVGDGQAHGGEPERF